MFLKLSHRFDTSPEDKKKIALYIIQKEYHNRVSVSSQVWEDEKGVDAAVLASAQHVSSFDAIPGLSLASRLVLGHNLSGPGSQRNYCFAGRDLLELLRICDNILKIFSSREGETEEERISKMMSNSTEMYSDKHWVKFKVNFSKKQNHPAKMYPILK